MIKVDPILKSVLSVLAIFTIPCIGPAAPFDDQFSFKQPDGTVIVLHGRGDEFYAEFETLDGYAVVYIPETRTHYFAKLAADGNSLVSTGLAVGKANPLTQGLAKHLRISADARRAFAAPRRKAWDKAVGLSDRWNARKQKMRQADGLAPASGASPYSTAAVAPRSLPSWTTTGNRVGLTILIDFSDQVATIPQTNIAELCNGTGYTGYNNSGSVKEYFLDNSGGLLTYTNIVTAYVRVPRTKAYYDDGVTDCGTRGAELLRDALGVLTNLPDYATTTLPAFASLSTDASNNVLACNVFYAGTVSSGWGYGLWSSSSALSPASVDLGNGKKVNRYQITYIGGLPRIGTFCHENGHMLCDYPDIYDYDYDSYGGAGLFCLMNSGAFGNTPIQICAYLKRASGWATTVDLNYFTAMTCTVSSVGAGFNRFYRYTRPGVSTEYFLVENRQASGRDSLLPASGVAVWHIDELGNRDNQSLTPNTTHSNYEVTLVQADNKWHFQSYSNNGDNADLYYSGNTAAVYTSTLNDFSSPSARWWDGSLSGMCLTGFSARATTMTFRAVAPAAASSVWSNLAGGSWALATNWLAGTPAFGAGYFADFSTLDLVSNTAVTLDGLRAIGELRFGDTTPSHDWSLSAGAGGSFLLAAGTNTPVIGVSNRTATIGVALSGTNGLLKTGGGTLVLTATNDYSGATTISAGMLQVGGAGQLGAGSYQDAITNNGALAFNSSMNQNLKGFIAGTGGVAKTGSGALYVVGTNTYSGITDIQGGYLEVLGGGALDIRNSVLNIGSGVNGTRAVDIWGGDLTVRGLTGGTTATKIVSNSGRTLVINTPAGESYAFAGVLQDKTWASGVTLKLIKQGAGTQTLSGAHTYTGSTSVDGGTLLFNGSGAASALAVAPGGTLGGTGVLRGATTVNGTLAPGADGIGTLIISNSLTLAGTTVVEINKAAGTCDKVGGVSTQTFGGALTVTNLAGTLAAGDSFTLFSAGAYRGDFTSYSLPALDPGLVWLVSKLTNNGSVSVTNMPALAQVAVVNNGISLACAGGIAGQNITVMTATNLAESVIWTPSVTTSTVAGPFSLTIPTNNSPLLFYKLTSP